MKSGYRFCLLARVASRCFVRWIVLLVRLDKVYAFLSFHFILTACRVAFTLAPFDKGLGNGSDDG